MATEKYRKFQAPNVSGMKVIKGTALGPAEYLSKHQIRMMNQQETAKYFSKVTRSKGFDVDGCTGCLSGGIAPIHPGAPDFELAKILTRWAAFTNSVNTRLSYLALVKANIQPVSGMMFYITFSAIDTVDQKKKYFHAQVYVKVVDWFFELLYFKEIKPPKIAGKGLNSPKKPVTSRNKAQGGSMLRSKISKAKKGAACVLPGFTVLVLDIKSRNPSMTHAMARAAASRKWKMLSNAEKQAFLSEAGLKTKV